MPFTLSGQIEADHVAEFQKLLEFEPEDQSMALDLK
jgi:hypothetical protein